MGKPVKLFQSWKYLNLYLKEFLKEKDEVVIIKSA